ncbi:MAG: hypothetical protein LM590_10575 [Thermofilum sp.]|nr:hypothetical protein [Thermofilum sp.]MCC6064842.1 hypothetical protein [Thermofilum sp.]
MSFELAREVLGYAKAELEKALRTGDTFLYRNAADKAFLALVVAVNACVRAIGGAEPASHSGRRLLGKMGHAEGPVADAQREDRAHPPPGELAVHRPLSGPSPLSLPSTPRTTSRTPSILRASSATPVGCIVTT